MLRVALYAGGACLLTLHYFLSRRAWVGFGAVVPALWISAVVFFIVQGNMTSAFHYIMATSGLVGLLFMWIAGRKNETREGSTP